MEPASQPPPGPAARGAVSPPMRALLLVVGTISLVLGLIGVVVPVLPTTPFLLVTAACYGRASARLYAWLLGQPSLGPIIATWQRSRALPPGVKPRALLAVAVTFGISMVLMDSLPVRVVLAVTCVVLLAFLYRLPVAQPAPETVTMDSSPPQE